MLLTVCIFCYVRKSRSQKYDLILRKEDAGSAMYNVNTKDDEVELLLVKWNEEDVAEDP